ncbi:hypothetical protein U1Q18_031294 [Sarracenia purpurea var. burkii]
MNRRKGKGGFIPRSSANQHQTLISHEYDDYEDCFPVLSGASSANKNRPRAPKRGTKFPVSVCNGGSEDPSRQSKIPNFISNRALSKGDVEYFESWLAKYRTSSQIAPPSSPSAAKSTTGKEVTHVEGTAEVKVNGAENGAKCPTGLWSSDPLKYEGIPDARSSVSGLSSDEPSSDKNCP